MTSTEFESANGLCIIPARGGSKRLPRKNLAILGGLSLVQRSIETAIKCRLFKTIILSSDDDEILTQAAPYPEVRPIRRDLTLADDSSTVLEVVCSLVDKYAPSHETIGLLLPTAPFCTPRHLREGYSLLAQNTEADGVVSLTEYEFPPQFAVRIHDDRFLTPYMKDSPLLSGLTRSQDQASLYRPNGAFYLHRLPAFCEHKSFWRGRILGYTMNRAESIDIDTEFDLRMAELLLAESSL